MKKLRRNICCLIIVIVMLLTICLPSYAATLEVNKQKLTEGFNAIFSEPLEDGWTSTVETKVKNITDNEIELVSGEKTYKFNYEIAGNKVIFKEKAIITDGMSYEKYEEETDNLSMPLLGYVAVNKIAGVEVEKSLNYILLSLFESALSSLGSLKVDSNAANDGYIIVADGVTVEAPDNKKVIKKSEFGKYAIEYAEYSYKDMIGFNDSKSLNTYSIDYKTNKTDKEFIIDSIVTVNLDGNFSKINQMNLGGNDSGKKHIYKEIESTQPNCGVTGSKTYKCTDCDATYTKVIQALEHNYVERITVNPTCSVEGSRTYVCEHCHDSYKVAISTTEHNYVERMRNDAECEKDGTIRYICSDCGDLYVKVTSKAKGHNYVETTTNATCTNSGIKTYKCSECGESYTEVTNKAKGHDYQETVTGNVKKYTCSNCGHSYTEEISGVTSENNIEQTSGSSIDYNKIIIIVGSVMLGLIVVIVIAIIILKSRE